MGPCSSEMVQFGSTTDESSDVKPRKSTEIQGKEKVMTKAKVRMTKEIRRKVKAER